MLETQMLKVLADELFEAESTATPIEPLSSRFSDLSVEDAYRIQLLGHERRLGPNRRVAVKKIGLTNVAMQKVFGVSEPDYGSVLDDMVFRSGELCSRTKMIAPKAEPEVAMMLKEPLRGPHVTIDDVLQATDYVVAALEILDSRIADWRIRLVDTIADNASSKYVVLSDRKVPIDAINLSEETVSFYKNGVLVDRSSGRSVLGGPAKAVAWLANRLGELGGGLEAGEFVMPGSFCSPTDMEQGDEIVAEFSRCGRVSIRVA
jgi:2-keto-4-pentenoate hydratase